MPKTDPLIPRDMTKAITRYEAEATKILQAFINTVEAKKPPMVRLRLAAPRAWISNCARCAVVAPTDYPPSLRSRLRQSCQQTAMLVRDMLAPFLSP
jgi:hypothetical protein